VNRIQIKIIFALFLYQKLIIIQEMLHRIKFKTYKFIRFERKELLIKTLIAFNLILEKENFIYFTNDFTDISLDISDSSPKLILALNV
jgi:hypothetical protein